MTLRPLSQTCMTSSRDVVWVTEMRRRLGAASVPIKNRLCRVGDKRDWASRTILISAPLVPPRYNCLCRPRIWGQCASPSRNSVLVHLECMSFGHDVRCTLRLLMWVSVCWVSEAKRAGEPDGRFGSRGGGCGRLYLGLPIINPQPPFSWVPGREGPCQRSWETEQPGGEGQFRRMTVGRVLSTSCWNLTRILYPEVTMDASGPLFRSRPCRVAGRSSTSARPALHDSLGLPESSALGPTKPLSVMT